jgi:tRNA (mo5U34)-methyltransferase
MSDPFDVIRHWRDQRSEKGWWHSFELPDGTRIDGVNSLDSLKDRIAQFPVPEDLRGKRVLDIGTWDGWFAFEMERRGAEVVAIDCWENPLFHEMHARLRSRVEYHQLDIFDLAPERIGRFDIVLFMGVLYHLKHPLLALERVCALSTDLACVDSFILREEHRPGEDVTRRAFMEFYETNEMGGQTDNWVGPSLECLLAFCRTAGFARVELRDVIEHSACVACYRRWLPPAVDAPPAPKLLGTFHYDNNGINFESHHGDYVAVWFDAGCARPTLDTVQPQVAEFGVRPLDLVQMGEECWQSNFRLPPGLAAGWRDVTVRVAGSLPSNALPIAIDMPVESGPIELTAVCDAKTFAANRLDLDQGRWLSLWIKGLPENADRNNIRVYLDGRRLKLTHVTRGGAEARQVNAEVPPQIPRGRAQLGVAIADRRSNVADLLIV